MRRCLIGSVCTLIAEQSKAGWLTQSTQIFLQETKTVMRWAKPTKAWQIDWEAEQIIVPHYEGFVAALQQIWRQAVWSHAKDKLQDDLQTSEVLSTCADRQPALHAEQSILRDVSVNALQNAMGDLQTCSKSQQRGDAPQLPD